jgi:hypothetical protein
MRRRTCPDCCPAQTEGPSDSWYKAEPCDRCLELGHLLYNVSACLRELGGCDEDAVPPLVFVAVISAEAALKNLKEAILDTGFED